MGMCNSVRGVAYVRIYPDPAIGLHPPMFFVYRDNLGYVNVDELKFVMRHLEDKMTEEEIEEMIREADHDNDGQISYDGKSRSETIFSTNWSQ